MSEQSHILHPTRDVVRDWRRGDGKKLADMLDAASTAFPGGGGWQITPEQIERWIRQSDTLAAHVTEDGDDIVAMCSVMATPGQREHCYVPYLGSHPDYHGRKHGKSVLHAVVEWACRAGFRKVDLNTWAGNMKAVPLYKKTGFMWRPDTTVLMENFVPAARRHPLGEAFFRRHDWYATLERSLDLVEDRVTRGKVRVYEYLWRAGDDDYLRMVFDRQSWRLIEVETPELAASCSLPDEDLVAGMPHRVEWRLENKRPEPVQVFLSARGEPGVEISQRESQMLTGSAQFEGEVTVDPGIAEKTRDPRAALLTTEVLIGDTELELTNGIGARQAVDVRLEAPRGIVLPGEEQQVLLTLRSHLDRKATAHLALRPVHNVDLVDRSARVDVEPHGSAEVPVRLRAAAPGTVSLEAEVTVRVRGRRVHTKTHPIGALACARQGLAGAVGHDTCLLCGGNLAVYASRRSGQFDVHHRLRGERAQRLHVNPPLLGPPFSWDDLFQERAEAWVEEGPGTVGLHLRSASVLHPGLILDRRITLNHSPLVEVVDTVTNGSRRSLDLERRQFLWPGSRRAVRRRWSVPSPGGPYTDYAAPGGRGVGRLNLPDTGDQWTQGWQACEGDDGVVSGVIWDRADVVDMEGFLQQKGGRLAPGRSLSLPALHLLVTDGTAETVRSWWQLLHGPPFGEDDVLPAPGREPIELALSPEPLVVAGDNAAARLSLRSAGRYTLDGRILVESGDLVRVDVKRVEVSTLTADNPVAQLVSVRRRRKGGNGATEMALSFESPEAVYRSRARVLVLAPKARPVEVAGDDGLYALSNGILTARIAPAFLGSMTSLEYRGVEYLNSSFPDGGQRHWRNPWHGGIHLVYDRLWERLHRERFRTRQVERRGAQGLVWRGLRLTCKVTQESARHHTLYVEYLLAPGADVLALVVGRRNTVGEWLQGAVGVNLWSNLAEAPGNGVFYTGDDRISPRAAPYQYGDFTWNWGGLVSDDGRALFIGSADRDARSGGWSGGPEGCILFGEVCREVPAGDSAEGLFFVAPAASLEEAKSGEPWAAFEGLP